MNTERFDELIREVNQALTHFLSLADQNIKYQNQLDTLAQQLNQKSDDLRQKQEKLDKEKTEIEQQKGFLVSLSAETKSRQRELKLDEERVNQLDADATVKLDQLLVERKELLELKADVNKFMELKKNLEQRESLILKEKAVDRERKEVLDQREQQLTERENRISKFLAN